MSAKRSSKVPIARETAKEFLPKELRNSRSIDLSELAANARKAIAGSEKSLEVAGDIANSNWLARLWSSGQFAQNVVESIGYIRDISKVNLALSAICNDLASANLLHAEKIDANHREISLQLEAVKQLTGELIEHLRVTRDSVLLQPIVQGLGQIDAADRDALQGWLRSFSEAIDLQYQGLQDEIKNISQQTAASTETSQKAQEKIEQVYAAHLNLVGRADRIATEFKRLEEAQRNQDSEHARQLVLFGSEVSNQRHWVEQRFQAFEASLSRSNEKLSEGLNQLNERLGAISRSLTAECKTREEQDASILEKMRQGDSALRSTISALNAHWVKRLMWVGGGLLLLQVIMFAYLLTYR